MNSFCFRRSSTVQVIDGFLIELLAYPTCRGAAKAYLFNVKGEKSRKSVGIV